MSFTKVTLGLITLLASASALGAGFSNDLLAERRQRACFYSDSDGLYFPGTWEDTTALAKKTALKECRAQSDNPKSCRFSYCTLQD